MTGNHKIEVLYSGKAIAGSPFSCQVFDASKVALQKIKTTNFAVGEDISFTCMYRIKILIIFSLHIYSLYFLLYFLYLYV